MNNTAIIVTGLPASGKSSVAHALAASLNIALFDKDDFLERLYEMNDVPDWDARKRLSRKSDIDFQAAAAGVSSAVLVSHWRPRTGSEVSGTATDWLKGSFDNVIEVFCRCPADVATQRFLTRKRHPGHMDTQRDPKQLAQNMLSMAGGYPLGVGPVVEVNTEVDVNIQNLLMQLAPYGASLD